MPPAKFVPDPAALPVIRQLFLLDFKPIEMTDSLERAAGRIVPLSEIQDTIEWLRAQWADVPGAEAITLSESQLWARSAMFQSDMLGLYADMLANARATMTGEFSHADGRPVIKTKPGEVLGVAEKILGLERQVVLEQRQARTRLLEATTGRPSVPTPAPARRFNPDQEDDMDAYQAPERTSL